MLSDRLRSLERTQGMLRSTSEQKQRRMGTKMETLLENQVHICAYIEIVLGLPE